MGSLKKNQSHCILFWPRIIQFLYSTAQSQMNMFHEYVWIVFSLKLTLHLPCFYER